MNEREILINNQTFLLDDTKKSLKFTKDFFSFSSFSIEKLEKVLDTIYLEYSNYLKYIEIPSDTCYVGLYYYDSSSLNKKKYCDELKEIILKNYPDIFSSNNF